MKPFSMLRLNKTRALLLPAILGSALITGCGGGSSGTTSSTLSGTAASGAPIIGTVTVKDSTSTEKTVQIAGDGSYSIDISGMTGPFLLKANGTVGGRSVTLFSAATTADVNGKINVTPLTDLIVANTAGKTSEEFYNNPAYSVLTKTKLDGAETTLETRLNPLLKSLGVTTSIDLLRVAFAADHNGLDAALDMLRITVDPTTKKATIANRTDNDPAKSITDDLTIDTDSSAIPTPAIDLTIVRDDLKAMQAQFDNLSNLFVAAAPLPNDPALLGLFDSTFKSDGRDLTAFLTDLVAKPGMVGIKFSNIVLDKYIDANNIRIRGVLILKNGKHHELEALMKKGANNSWLIAGDQKLIEIGVTAHAGKSASGISTGLNFHVDGVNADPALATLSYAMVTGPGLPTGGIKLVKVSGEFVVDGTTSHLLTATSCPTCTLSSIPDNAVYTFKFYDASNTVLNGAGYDVVLPKAPYSTDYLTTNASTVFPSITPPTLSSFTAGGNPTVSWTLPAGMKADELTVALSAGSNTKEVGSDLAATDTSKVVSLGALSFMPTSVLIRINYEDIYGREFGMSTMVQ